MQQSKEFNQALPGFGQVLSSHPKALARYAGLSAAQRRQVLAGTSQLRTQGELEQYVDRFSQSDALS